MKNERNLTFEQFIYLFTSKWKIMLISCVVFLIVAIIRFMFFPEYTGVGRLVIKDFRNSQLQMSLVQVTNPGDENSKVFSTTEDTLLQTEAFLESHYFYEKLSEKLLSLQNKEDNYFFKEFLSKCGLNRNDLLIRDSLAFILHGVITFQKIKSNIIKAEAKTSSRDLSAYFVNHALIVARDELIKRELDDLTLAEKYFSEEIQKKKVVITQIEKKTLSKMKNQQVYSISSEKNDNNDYINELRKNINNIKTEILANTNKLDSFGNFKNQDLVNLEKYSIANQAVAIKEQNKSLEIKLAALTKTLNDFEKNQLKLLPLEYELEQQNSLHQAEYKIFDTLKANLARIGLQKIYAQNKIIVLDFERASHLKSSPSLLTLFLASQALAFCLSFFIIFSLELLNENWSNDETQILKSALA